MSHSLLPSLLTAVVAVPPAEPTPQASPPVQRPSVQGEVRAADEDGVRLRAAVVSIEGIPHEDLERALSLRAKGVAILRHEDRPEPAKPYVFVGVRKVPDVEGVFELELIVSDGRAYDRLVEAEDDQAARAIASNVAQLMAGIEDGTVAPDRSDVPIPEPQPAQPKEKCEPTPAPPLPTPEPEPEPRPPSPEIGLTPALGSVIGLGPPATVDRFAAWGGGLGLGVRLRRGAIVVADARVAGRGHHTGFGIVRTRIGLGGGYVVRAADFEMPAVLAATVEPWVMVRNGQTEGTTTLPGEPASRQILVGGAVRLSPGYRIEPEKTPNVAFRIGFSVELAASWVADREGGIARVLVDDGNGLEPALRVGGAELFSGIDATIWFRLRRQRRR